MFCCCYTILDSFTSTLPSAQSPLGKCGRVYCVAFRDLTMCVMHNYTRFIWIICAHCNTKTSQGVAFFATTSSLRYICKYCLLTIKLGIAVAVSWFCSPLRICNWRNVLIALLVIISGQLIIYSGQLIYYQNIIKKHLFINKLLSLWWQKR